LLVERADHRGDVGLEKAITDANHRQADQHDHHEQGRAIRVGLEGALLKFPGFASIAVEKRHRAIVIALDLQPVLPGNDVTHLIPGRGWPVDGVFDHDFIPLAVDHRVRLGGFAAEAKNEIAKAHHDCAELHRALRAEVAVGHQAADQRGEVHQRSEPAIEPIGGVVGEEEMLGEVERQQGAHAVIAEPLPHLGGE
jgi:hypothetical protein